MNLDYCLNQLAVNAVAIQQLVAGVDAEQARWKPAPDRWSILEVINHLADEEREDFRARVEFILSGAPGDPPPIDPVAKVTERSYNTRDLHESLSDYMRERQKSLEWLKGLSNPQWDNTYTASWGSIRVGDMMVSWAAHDLLHLRQINELKWAYNLLQYAPYSVDYAGDW